MSERFLSSTACEELIRRVRTLGQGGGETSVRIESRWSGNLRWARNRVTTSGDVRETDVSITRTRRGVSGSMSINQIDGPPLEAAVRRAERVIGMQRESDDAGVMPPPELAGFDAVSPPHAHPLIWSDATYALDAERRHEAMRALVQPAVAAGVWAAGYLEVSAYGRSVSDDMGRTRYYPFTRAQYSVTVRDSARGGSGWAGVDWHDWDRIDAATLSATALEKCLRSRDPVAVEPGRWTVVLEPQAVCDFVSQLFSPGFLYRAFAEGPQPWPYGDGKENSRIGERIMDERITVRTDCMDPDLGFAPFSQYGDVYAPVTWVERGVLRALSYDRRYAVTTLGVPRALPTPGAFHMSGGTASLAELIASTTRGLLVTRFSNMRLLDQATVLSAGYTRDGVWLIEKGVVTKSVKNFRFTESPLFALNNVEQIGASQRVFHPETPVIVPPLVVRDFSFTSLADSV